MRPLLENTADITLFRNRLLDWYAANKRDLTWRNTDDPYHIWVSEVMLQQTRVEQMNEYFERFIRQFPTVHKLAGASEGEVLKAWEGLGYYARARNLHVAARQLVEESNGDLPRTREELEKLPGIGSYTGAAISSIAFDADHPVLDGNVTRVLCRVLLVADDPRKTATRMRLIKAGETLLPCGRAGEFNQALMELGARVCTPAQPSCGGCPLRSLCRANMETDDPGRLPAKAPKRKKPHYQVAAGVIWKADQLLIAQRPSDGLLGGLWEFPGGKIEEGESLEECLVREIREELAVTIEVGERIISVDHGYSHFGITLHAFAARWLEGAPQALGCADWRWVSSRQLDDFAFPRADRYVIEAIREAKTQIELFPAQAGEGGGDDG